MSGSRYEVLADRTLQSYMTGNDRRPIQIKVNRETNAVPTRRLRASQLGM